MSIQTRLAVAATAIAVVVPAQAHAAPPNDAEYTGGCVLAAAGETTQLLRPVDRFQGVLVGAVVGHAGTLGHNPVHVTVSCEVRVNGVTKATTAPAANYVAAATVGGATFDAGVTDVVKVCTNVTTFDAHFQTRTFSDCAGVSRTQVPPQEAVDLLDPACGVGGVVCAILQANRINLILGTPQL